MKDAFASEVAREGDDPEIEAILLEVCHATRMGFVAVARVTEDRWIAAQVLDRIDFGLNPGDELDVKKTICDEIRDCGQAIIIDRIFEDPELAQPSGADALRLRKLCVAADRARRRHLLRHLVRDRP